MLTPRSADQVTAPSGCAVWGDARKGRPRGRLRGRRRPRRRGPVTRRWSGPLREPSPALRQPSERVWRKPGPPFSPRIGPPECPPGRPASRGTGASGRALRGFVGRPARPGQSLGLCGAALRGAHATRLDEKWALGARPRRWPGTGNPGRRGPAQSRRSPVFKNAKRGTTRVLPNPTSADMVI